MNPHFIYFIDKIKKICYNIYRKNKRGIQQNNIFNWQFVKKSLVLINGEKAMYICPTCNKSFETEERIQKHFLKCWKEKNPYHQSKPAPRSEDVETVEINDDVVNFFNSLMR